MCIVEVIILVILYMVMCSPLVGGLFIQNLCLLIGVSINYNEGKFLAIIS